MADAPAPRPKDANGHDAQDRALAELRRLLMGPAQTQIEHLRTDLDGIEESYLDRVADVLPDAIVARRRRDEQLAQALGPTVEETLRQAVRRDPRPLADALYPVIGPAIRKSIRETLSGMLQAINQALEHSLSPRSLRWRVESWRTGEPFAQIVLRHTMQYRVEQIFLIDRETGLLLTQATAASLEHVQDGALVSGMLTAIQDFVTDSFGAEETETLETMQVGDLTVWIEPGPQALVAAVVRGLPSPELRELLHSLTEQLHLLYGPEMATFSGDTTPFEPAQPLLEAGLVTAYKQGEQRSTSPVLWLLVIALLVALTAWGLQRWQNERRWAGYLASLEAAPGLVVVETGGGLGYRTLHGLRDPLAAQPDSLRAAAGLGGADIRERWEPYQALDDALVVRRARQLLQAPATVELYASGGRLVANGQAPPDWVRRARSRALFLPGVMAYDDAGLNRDALAQARAAVERQSLQFEAGTALLRAGQNETLQAVADAIRLLLDEAARLGQPVRVDVIGYASREGSPAFNARVSAQRAERVRDQLVAAGLAPEALSVLGTGSPRFPADASADPDAIRARNRSVGFRVVPLEADSVGTEGPG